MTDRSIYGLTGHINPTDILTLADGQAAFLGVSGTQAMAGELRINSGVGVNFARVREFGTVDGTNYGYAETAMGLTNPLASTHDVFLYSFGSEGRYNSSGVVTARDFYIYDVVASGLAGSNVYRLYTDETGVVNIGGSDAHLAPALSIATTGDATLKGNLTASPPASATPASNGQMTFELTSNTTLKVKVKGSDGTVRSVSLTLA